ncbi:LETM1 domain-containing protein 1 isoform X4 [Leucoraja erinacea]|uniref:LETM1 domain-containing protein 1 isoform X4 n=1 Tax=Leucoraja erinaceus TaxID=7782 RepID=UPI002455898F|nr:LETM1 domain-containing protein 1 isoform X4 [Leucoraja erinacea]
MALARICFRLQRLKGRGSSEFLYYPTICVSRLTSHQLSQFFTTAKRSTLSSAIISKAKRLNAKYEKFLEINFPRFYGIYSTFFRGFRLLYLDFKEVHGIKYKMANKGLKYNQLPYREMEKLRQFRRDVIKVIPVVLLAIPPFANYIVFILMYFFPRQFLISHFWTHDQHQEFKEIYHSFRAQVYPDAVQDGIHPEIFQLHIVAKLFLGHPLAIRHIDSRQAACYVRGLNSVHLNAAQCKDWLIKWVQLSKKLKDSEASLLLHSMVLLSTNYLKKLPEKSK